MNKFNQGGIRLVYWTLQNIAEIQEDKNSAMLH